MNLERLSKDEIKAQILGAEFTNTGKITICVLTTRCGYQIVGSSGTIDTSKFDVELGNKYAFEDALNKLWAFEAYFKERAYRLENPFSNDGHAFRPTCGSVYTTTLNVEGLEKYFSSE